MGTAADRVMDQSCDGVQVAFLVGTAIPQVIHYGADRQVGTHSRMF